MPRLLESTKKHKTDEILGKSSNSTDIKPSPRKVLVKTKAEDPTTWYLVIMKRLGYETLSLFFPKYSCFRCLGVKSSCKYTTISVINNVRVFFHLIFLKCCILLTIAQITFKFSGLLLWSLGTISTDFCGKILKIADFVTIYPCHVFFTITRYIEAK